MPISPQEQQDLDLLHKARNERQVQMYDYMCALSNMTAEGLKHSGHKCLNDAIVYAFNAAKRDIDRLVKMYLKKYPD